MTTASWDNALDEFEALLRRQEAAVAGRGPIPPHPNLPDVEGPIPDHLKARARALLEQCHRLEDRTAEAMAELRRRQPTFATGAPAGNELGRL